MAGAKCEVGTKQTVRSRRQVAYISLGFMPLDGPFAIIIIWPKFQTRTGLVAQGRWGSCKKHDATQRLLKLVDRDGPLEYSMPDRKKKHIVSHLLQFPCWSLPLGSSKPGLRNKPSTNSKALMFASGSYKCLLRGCVSISSEPGEEGKSLGFRPSHFLYRTLH